MSKPSPRAVDPERLAGLRRRATSRLVGAPADPRAGLGSADALSVLHALASDPQTASDALTLLHELQVLQVELELQAQELHESRAELESALRRQIELYDGQPAGCLTIDAQRRLQEMNLRGAELLGLARDEAYGQLLDNFFSPGSAASLRAAIARVASGEPRAQCLVVSSVQDSAPGSPPPLLASVGADSIAGQYLVNLVPAAGTLAADLPPGQRL